MLADRYQKIPIRKYQFSNRYVLSEDSSQKGVRNERPCDQLKYVKEMLQKYKQGMQFG